MPVTSPTQQMTESPLYPMYAHLVEAKVSPEVMLAVLLAVQCYAYHVSRGLVDRADESCAYLEAVKV